MIEKKIDGYVILGPTASGKTRFGVNLAAAINGEIISADSRQVYKHLNIGTGKDYEEYTLNRTIIPYHLIDICEPQNQYFLKDFIRDSTQAIAEVTAKEKMPIICGGTGLYLDTFHKDFSLTLIPENKSLREELVDLEKSELIEKLNNFKQEFRKEIDLNSKKRIIRAIEQCVYLTENELPENKKPNFYLKYIGLNPEISLRREKIDTRLKLRLKTGLIEEVENMRLQNVVSDERLQFLGLEYKFVLNYLNGEITKQALYENLRIAIHQYAKRQMTWFRKMEKEGIQIEWIT